MKLTPRNIRKIILIIATGILIYVFLTNLDTALSLLGQLTSVLSPVIVGCCVAFVLNVIMQLFDKFLFRPMDKSRVALIRKAKRPCSIICTLILAAGLIALAMLVIVPQLEDALSELIRQLPGYATAILQWMKELLQKFDVPEDQIRELASDWTQLTRILQNWIVAYSNTLLNSAVNITVSVLGTVFDGIMSLVIAIYILLRKERIGELARKTGRAFLREKSYLYIERIAKLTNEAFTNFLAGQFIEAIILGVLCFMGMVIFRFPYAGVISVLVALTSLIPIFGAWIGGGISALLILMDSPMKALLFILYILILQQLEGNLIYPKVVGKKVGLPGLLVLVAVVLGSKMGGVLGMLVSVPLVSIIYALFKEAIDRRLAEKARKEEFRKKNSLREESE